jgi:plastocyanin
MRRAVTAATVVGVLAVAVAGCGGYGKSKSGEGGSTSSGGEGGGGQTVIAGVKANNHGSKTVSENEAKVELDDFYFEPTVLKGKPGQRVTLELENEGKVEHNFSIGSQSLDKDLEAGEDAKVTVTIPKSGVVSFYCKYHKAMGMAGALATSGSHDMSGGGGGTNTRTSTGYSYP